MARSTRAFWQEEPVLGQQISSVDPKDTKRAVHIGNSEQCTYQILHRCTWPPAKEHTGPRWHDAYQPARPLIVFGHDARGGLVVKERDDKPYLLGLDSGCVYGNQLSAYILEEARLVRVPSRQQQGEWLQRDA